MDASTLSKIHRALGEIGGLAREIEEVPNFPQDRWTMAKIDEKAQRIQKLARAIASALGTGDVRPGPGPGHPNTGDGGFPNTGHG